MEAQTLIKKNWVYIITHLSPIIFTYFIFHARGIYLGRIYKN